MSRLFFGFEVETAKLIKLPPARHLHEKYRHITFAFLGDVDLEALLQHLERFPKPEFTMGFVGEFTEPVFLPPSQPHAAAWKVDFGRKERTIRSFQQQLSDWLRIIGFPPTDPDRDWLPHVTMGRNPFDANKWREQFQHRPFVAWKFHLYESMGELKYEPRWTYSLVRPFEDTEVGIRVRGKSLDTLLLHAQVVLAEKFPELWDYFQGGYSPRNYRDLMMHLNTCIMAARAKFGLSLKSIMIEDPPEGETMDIKLVCQ